MARTCQSCGCACEGCFSSSLDFHQQIEELQSQLRCSNSHITQIEHELLESKQATDTEVLKLRDDIAKLRDRYDRLFESHKRLQRVNHSLEDKLLKVVNVAEAEKMVLQKEMSEVTSKLVSAKETICELEDENERYHNDCNLAVQLLQCRPSNFVAHKMDSLPYDLQERVKSHLSRQQVMKLEDAAAKEQKVIRVPMPTFPPTAMLYSINGTNTQKLNASAESEDTVPLSMIAKILSQPENSRRRGRTHICIKCKKDIVLIDREIQTIPWRETDRGGAPAGAKVHRQSGRIRQNSTETEI